MVTIEAREIVFWFLGAICVLFGAMIAGQAQPTELGSTDLSYILAIIIAFLFILVGGLLWISLASTVEEE